jgi:histidinol-phosphate aminotransferase
VSLNDHFQMSAKEMLAATDRYTKLIWICSPNNPTGNLIDHDEIEKVLKGFDGIVIIDEAYSDFSGQPTFREVLDQYPNLIVLNTMSKAWALASIRLGMAFASKEIVNIYNKVKYPYNVNLLSQRQAIEVLSDPFQTDKWVKLLLQERARMILNIKMLPLCEHIYPTDANFFLMKVDDAQKIYDYLVEKGIIVRNRTRVQLCHNCLRITIGNKSENNELLSALRQY